MRKIVHWSIDQLGSIRGDTIGEAHDRGIRTSPVVSREGDIVVTRSGNRYQLVDPPHPYMTDIECLNLHWFGATDPLDAIDRVLARLKGVRSNA
jgi:hypothetical protein